MNRADTSIREQAQKIVANFRLMDDDFMAAVFSDTECAELLLRVILDRDDLHVKASRPQYEIKNLEHRSVRLDIFAEDTQGQRYNVEIQRNDRGAAAQRARYNASLIDAEITVPNENFRDIPQVYVIFITEHDVLKGGLPIYHIDRTIAELKHSPFGDGSHILYVNSQIQDGTKLGKLMQDFYSTQAGDMHYSALAERVKYFKEPGEGNITMCRSVEKLVNEQREIGEKIGKEIGQEIGKEIGRENALLETLHSIKETLHLTTDQAMDAMKISQEERPRLREKLAQ